MPKRKTNIEFTQQIYDLVKDEYSFLDEYINSAIEIRCRHNKCGYIWKIKPNNFISNNNRCPHCGSSQKVRSKNAKKEILNFLENNLGYKVLNKDFILNENNFLKDITFKLKCPHCGSISERRFSTIQLSYKQKTMIFCDKCNKNNTISKKEFISKNLKELIKEEDSDYDFIKFKDGTKYTGVKQKFYVRHILCGKLYLTTYHNFFINKNRCNCNNIFNGEYQIKIFLDKKSIRYIREFKITKSKYLKNKPFDFYLPDYNLLIEFNGTQHYQKKFYMSDTDLKNRKITDHKKIKYARHYNFNILIISYKDINRIPEIINNKIVTFND